MILSDTAIRRPVLTTMAIGAIAIFGVLSFRETGIDLLPRVEFPVVTIFAVLPGADPETIESRVTDPIEQAVSTIGGIKHLRSTSSDGVGQVFVEFELEKDVDVAYQEIQAKIGMIRSELPNDLEDPVIEKFDIDAAPVLTVVTSGDLPIRDLTEIVDDVVKERLQRIPGVGQVRRVGGRERRMWLWLDRERLEGYGLSVGDVERALEAEHVEQPGGRVETDRVEWVVKTRAEFESEHDFADLLLAYRGGVPIRLSDVGRAEDGLEDERSLARLDDTRAVSLLVRRQSGTNTVEVARAVKAEVARIQEELAPRGMRLEISQDLSSAIVRSVEEVQGHLVYGGALAVLIVLVFLRNLRSTFISSLVLPTSVLGTFILIHAMGFTQNMMTLLALSLAIGLLIDDAIVVQENIMRHVEEGKPARDAAHAATREIAPAVVATTLSVVAVFVPVAFMKGIVGRFLYQFGLTVAFAVTISMFVSFTLDPMLSARILRVPRRGLLFRILELPFTLLERAYRAVLWLSLRARWLVVLLVIGSLLATGRLARSVRSEFVPTEDQGEFLVRVEAPLGSSLATTDAVLREVQAELAGEPWVDYTFALIGADQLDRVNEGSLYVKLVPKERRTLGQREAIAWARARLARLQGKARISVSTVTRISGGGQRSADVQIELRGPGLDVLHAAAKRLMERMRGAGGYADVDTTYREGKPEIDVYVRRDRAADLGVSPRDVATAVQALIGGKDLAKFRAGSDRYDVSVRLQGRDRDRPEAIEELSVRSRSGELVRLGDLARVARRTGPVQIDRYNRARQVTLLANLDRKVLGEAVAEIRRFADDEELPPGYSFAFAGRADTMAESMANLSFAMVLGIVIVYMVLASQFESFIHPFTIMLSVPLSVIGAIGALAWTGFTVNIYTMIGMILLVGLVTKNGILLVDRMNALRKDRGLDLEAAVLEAGPVRLRPILMTTMAMISGMLPVALARGEGSESRAPMAVAVIGGLVTSTVLTLLVVPVAYTIFDDLAHPGRWRLVRLLRRAR